MGHLTGNRAYGHIDNNAKPSTPRMHAEAGKEAGPGLIAEDLPEALPAVYRRLFGRS